ncbi:MAG: hypothetical protein K0S70_2891 [Microbacterium sp.]|jgi:hypothetical protein|nr:hypothetical protein [Microbacterium sp.]
MVAIVLAIVGVFVGVLIADARFPSVRPAPFIAALGLGITGAATLFLWQPAGLLEGVAYAFGVVAGTVGYAVRAWGHRIPASLRPGIGALMWMAFSKPEYLRELASTRAAVSVSSPVERAETGPDRL